MGSSELRILIKDPNYPCKPYERTGHWFKVDIMHCNGDFLKWNGIIYRGYPLKRRIHDQVKVPPGCYVVRAYAPCGNVTTQTAVIQVCCDQIVCVNLLATNPRFCFIVAKLALNPEIIANVPREVIANANDAIAKVIGHLPREVLPEPPENLVDELLKEAEELEEEEYVEEENERKSNV